MTEFAPFVLLNAAPPAAPEGAPNPLLQMVIMGGAIMVMFYFLLVRPNQRRDRERREMLGQLKKNDHVITVGGIKGVVANVKADEDEIVLRVDDATGAKIRVTMSSIARVVVETKDEEAAKKDS